MLYIHWLLFIIILHILYSYLYFLSFQYLEFYKFWEFQAHPIFMWNHKDKCQGQVFGTAFFSSVSYSIGFFVYFITKGWTSVLVCRYQRMQTVSSDLTTSPHLHEMPAVHS